MSGVSNTGGLIGLNHNGVAQNNYWDVDTTGQSVAFGNDNNSQIRNSGLMTGQMQDLGNFRVTYNGWNFENIWAPPNSVGQSGQGSNG